jgi:hypothetical protein
MTAFVSGRQEDGPEPLLQGRARTMKHRPGSYRYLFATVSALAQGTRPNHSNVGGTTTRTLSPKRKPQCREIVEALLTGRKTLLKVQKPHPTVRYWPFRRHYRTACPQNTLILQHSS